MKLQPGIHRISDDLYHSDPCPEPSLSRSTICDLINYTPAHAHFSHPALNPDYHQADSDKFDIGKAAHALFLEGLDNAVVVDAPDWRKKEAKDARDSARLAGNVPLLAYQYDSVQRMVNAAHTQLASSELAIKDLHAGGDSELTYIWREGEAWCRVRPDWISHKPIGDRKLILDYKTVGDSADPNAFIRKVMAMGYDIQHSFYRRGVHAIEREKPPRFIFMVQETFEPFLCSFIGLDPMSADIGEQKTAYGLHLWRQCMVNNDWPAYPNRICYVETPSWAAAQWEAKAQEMEVLQ